MAEAAVSISDSSFFHWIFRQGEHDDAFAGAGANVGVEAQDANAEDGLNSFLEEFSPVFDQFDPELFDEIATPVRVFELGKSLFSGRQDTPEPDKDHVLDQVRPHLLRSTTHILPLEPNDRVTDFGLEFALRLHSLFSGRPAHNNPQSRVRSRAV